MGASNVARLPRALEWAKQTLNHEYDDIQIHIYNS